MGKRKRRAFTKEFKAETVRLVRDSGKALAEALRSAETKAATIREELRSLETTAADVFKAPPVEWVTARLEKVQEVLERETGPSALLLRRILGPIRLAPITPQVGRPYYQAETALQVLELIQDPEGGSTSLSWWRRWELNPRPKTLSLRRLRR